MKAITMKLVGIMVIALIFGLSIVVAQNGNGSNSPPSNGSQNQTRQQNQNQDCLNGCAGTQNQNQNQAQNQVQNQNQDCSNGCDGTQNQNQVQNQNQDCPNGCDGTQAQNQAQNQNQVQNQVNDCPNCSLSQAGDLPDDVVAAMYAGIIDEYTAYQVYAAIMAQFGEIAPFSTIQRAEAEHIRVWTYMFTKYGLTLPEVPVVDVPAFDTLADACAYALNFEMANGALYDGMLTTVADYRNLTNIVTALQSASLNHHVPALEQCAGL